MDTLKKTVTPDSTLILTTEGDLLRYLKSPDKAPGAPSKMDLPKSVQGLPSLLDLPSK